jgi:hypothetical protein
MDQAERGMGSALRQRFQSRSSFRPSMTDAIHTIPKNPKLGRREWLVWEMRKAVEHRKP